ncbi:hypothetical protein QBC46DRAFT_400919 [Diplogelasinospora grovesii]|uniref:BTB domain-containing protein n=1 Tax=Diplogelasinospora grovesii TaxID=303347 RepID=A0AAN6RYX5_9PEZI|nr:hypothetical protein QBC46DRAFT_400919 [Diplogelasinospora grovesii]
MAAIIDVDPNGDLLLQFPGLIQQADNNALDRDSGLDWENLGGPMALEQAGSECTVDNEPERDQPPQPQAVNLRVSSSVLRLVSPVFSAMLNGPMSEAQAFRAPNSPRPFPITLPEDDGVAFAILANVIHHRAEAIPFLPARAMLVALARLADKYACAPALMPYGVLWLQRATSRYGKAEFSNSDLDGRCCLLLFAYVLDLPQQFFEISWDIILKHRQLLKDEIDQGLQLPIHPDHELLRHDLHGELARRKARLRRDVHNAIMNPVSRVRGRLNDGVRSPGFVSPSCQSAALAIGQYMGLLDYENLCPWRSQYETDSLGAIIHRAFQAAEDNRENPMLRFEMCTRSRCACSSMTYGETIDLPAELEAAIGKAWEWKLGACLDCLKNGGKDRSRCRVEHW